MEKKKRREIQKVTAERVCGRYLCYGDEKTGKKGCSNFVTSKHSFQFEERGLFSALFIFSFFYVMN